MDKSDPNQTGLNIPS